MKDRTGEECPICKEGTLHPTGKREFKAPNKALSSGEEQRETTEYLCDKCGNKCNAHGIVLHETMGISDTAQAKTKK
jgi:hypothetical protein